jgi:hypothetical protein
MVANVSKTIALPLQEMLLHRCLDEPEVQLATEATGDHKVLP